MRLALLVVASLALASPAFASEDGEELAVNYNGEIHGWGSATDAEEAPQPAPLPPAQVAPPPTAVSAGTIAAAPPAEPAKR